MWKWIERNWEKQREMGRNNIAVSRSLAAK